MDQQALISVVIPSYNRKDKLPACIESVLGQSYKNIEVIVVDDASTDGTPALFQRISDPRLRYLRYEENRGACYARNYGARRASGQFLAFQDSDDTWHPEKLEKQLACLLESGADMCFCGMNRISADGSRFYYPVHGFDPGRALEQFLAENRASTQTMLMRRYVWEELGFDESFRRYQDWDFSIRAAAAFRLCYLPLALADSEVGTDSISFAVKSYPALVHLYEKHAALYEANPESDAMMNRRMGRRLHRVDPVLAAGHFLKCFKLSHKWYDLAYYFSDAVLSRFSKKKKEEQI
ncbi:MAG: glycosyltransferase family 2 protein [Firmicutes bacterium]|nr:glycosyltransferase family 2 protein [Oscillospiraceae bacterium]MBS5433242.1 glycosyltransferase family 2 protein [Bacillota bacterium]